MTLHEMIYMRRQVRKYNSTPIKNETIKKISNYISDMNQLSGYTTKLEVVSNELVTGGSAPYYILSYCDNNAISYVNTGFMLQKVDLYMQSIGLGSGWFMGVKPVNGDSNFCIALAFGNTDVPIRNGISNIKRLPIKKISNIESLRTETVQLVTRAIQIAPSSMNSQPWKIDFENNKVIINEYNRGVTQVMLRSKLNKIDIGIAVRNATLALEHDEKNITSIVPYMNGKKVTVEISYN